MDDPWSPRPGAPGGPATPRQPDRSPYATPYGGHGRAPAPAPYGAPRAAAAPGYVAGKERPFWQGFLLAAVTLTVYHYFWHYLTHDEVSRQLGRENREKGLFVAYVLVSILTLVLFIVGAIALVAALGSESFDENMTDEEFAQRVLTQGGTALVLFALGFLGTLASPILLLVFAYKQTQTLQSAFGAYGQPRQMSAGPFIGLYIGAFLASWLIPVVGAWLGVVLLAIAYHTLQEPYNRFWRLALHGTGQAVSGGPSGAALYPASYGPPGAHGARGPSTGDAFGTTVPGGTATQGTQPRAGHAESRPMGPYAGSGERVVEQPFRCPRCHAHVTARGPPGTQVHVQCPSCGQSGEVLLGRT